MGVYSVWLRGNFAIEMYTYIILYNLMSSIIYCFIVPAVTIRFVIKLSESTPFVRMSGLLGAA